MRHLVDVVVHRGAVVAAQHDREVNVAGALGRIDGQGALEAVRLSHVHMYALRPLAEKPSTRTLCGRH